jgi:transcriptional regulator with XRE-family HTH domain
MPSLTLTTAKEAMDSDPSSATRGPYAGRRRAGTEGRPSVALAANVRAYRVLQHMTQYDLALRMTDLGHDWGRSTVSAVERKSRNVITDELFGLALSFGATIGGLLDPTGPDHSRNLSFDVGLVSSGLIDPGVARLWGASRVVLRLGHEDRREYALDVAEDPSLAASLDALKARLFDRSRR